MHVRICTPQFDKDGTIKKMFEQDGVIDPVSMRFTPDSIFGHTVHFHSKEDIDRAVVKIYD